jgi:hypothetical protein
VFVFAAIILSCCVIYRVELDNPEFGWFPFITIICLLAIGARADAIWRRLRRARR